MTSGIVTWLLVCSAEVQTMFGMRAVLENALTCNQVFITRLSHCYDWTDQAKQQENSYFWKHKAFIEWADLISEGHVLQLLFKMFTTLESNLHNAVCRCLYLIWFLFWIQSGSSLILYSFSEDMHM